MAFDHSKETVMLEFKSAAAKKCAPTLGSVCSTFNFAVNEIDPGFGVVASGDNHLVTVTKEAGERVQNEKHPDFVAIWSNPKFEPFGIPRR